MVLWCAIWNNLAVEYYCRYIGGGCLRCQNGPDQLVLPVSNDNDVLVAAFLLQKRSQDLDSNGLQWSAWWEQLQVSLGHVARSLFEPCSAVSDGCINVSGYLQPILLGPHGVIHLLVSGMAGHSRVVQLVKEVYLN